MELFHHIRRLSKRSLLCFCFSSAMLLVCAFYTLFPETYFIPPATPHHIRLTSNSINFVDENLPKRFRNKTHTDDAAIVPAAASWTASSASNLSSNNAPNKNKQTIANDTSPFLSITNSEIKQTDTKYVYLTNFPSYKTSNKPTRALPRRTTQPDLTSDTCQTYSMKDFKLVLLWTSFFDTWEYISEKKFQECDRCRNCKVTRDRTLLKESDAVVFHARDMSLTDLPPVRYPHQRWIFYCLESPPYSIFPGMDHMIDLFNWTMTYRRDSDVPSYYGKVVKIRPSGKLDLQSLQWTFNNKTKSVVWMSSHCPTYGGRDGFIKELQKYIDVDIYGTCGTFVCPRNGTDRCFKEFAFKYKFFLAFENTICKDYVTEKFFRTLQYNIIPVVFGGASYAKFGPPGSFIDALSFKSPKHLAFFLAGIGKNFKLWSTYFRWRKDYNVEMSRGRECNLCSMLHRRDLKPSSYHNLKKWWVTYAHCRTWKPK